MHSIVLILSSKDTATSIYYLLSSISTLYTLLPLLLRSLRQGVEPDHVVILELPHEVSDVLDDLDGLVAVHSDANGIGRNAQRVRAHIQPPCRESESSRKRNSAVWCERGTTHAE